MDNISPVLTCSTLGVSRFLWKEACQFCVCDRGSHPTSSYSYLSHLCCRTILITLPWVCLLLTFSSPVAILKSTKYAGIPHPCVLLKGKEDHKCSCPVHILLLFSCLPQPGVFELFARQRPICSSDLISKGGDRCRLVVPVHLWMCAIKFHGSICKTPFMSFLLDRSLVSLSPMSRMSEKRLGWKKAFTKCINILCWMAA